MTYTPNEQTKQDYIQNKLSPESKLQFETWLFDHPNEQDELELDLILKAGVKRYYKEDAVEKESKISWMPAFGIAAAFIVMTWGLFISQGEMTDNHGLIAPQISVFSQLRSAEQMTWELNAENDQLIQIPVAYLSDAPYQVNISGVTSLQLKNIQPHLDMVSLIIAKDTLKIGAYQLELINQTNQEKQQFAFLVK